MLASEERDRLFRRSTDFGRVAVFPAIDGQRFRQMASKQMENSRSDSNWVSADNWIAEIFGEGRTQVAIVSGDKNGYSPFAHGRELFLSLLAANGKHTKERAGPHEVVFELNHVDLGLRFEDTIERLLGAKVAYRREGCLVLAEGRMPVSDKSFAQICVQAEHDWPEVLQATGMPDVRQETVKLRVTAIADNSSGLLGVLTSVICRLRPVCASVGAERPTPWYWRDLTQFLSDYHGRTGWRNKTPAERFANGFSLALPASRPFWLAAPEFGGEMGELEGKSLFEMAYRDQELHPTTVGDDDLAVLIKERLFLVRGFKGGLFFEWAG